MPGGSSTTLMYTRNELLSFNSKSLPFSRKVRKSVFSCKIWCPYNQRLAISKPKNKENCSGTKCGLLNARSINNKEAIISDLLISKDLDFLFLTETWCHDNSSVSIELLKPRGYDGKFCNRDGKGGGGVGVIYKLSTSVKVIPSKKCSTFDHIVVKIQYGKETLKAFVIYKPDGGYSQLFHNEFTDLLNIQFSRDGFKPLIIGDFNIHVNKSDTAAASKFLDTIDTYQLTQHVNFPTHDEGNTLDLVISSDVLGISNLEVDASVRSDHRTVIFQLKSSRPSLSQQSLQYRSWAKVDIPSLETSLKSYFEKLSPDTLDDAVELYNSGIAALADELAPVKTRTITLHPDAPWFTDELKRQKQLRRRLERQAVRTNLRVHWDIHNEQRDRYNLLLESAQTQHYRQFIGEAASSRDQWRSFNKLLGNSSSSPLPSHESKQELSDRFNAFFVDKIKTIRMDLAENVVEYPDHLKNTRPSFTGSPMEDFQTVTEDEVEKVIKAAPNSSCSLDPLPTWMLKKCLATLLPIITLLVNLSLKSGEFCSTLKKAFVTPLFGDN